MSQRLETDFDADRLETMCTAPPATRQRRARLTKKSGSAVMVSSMSRPSRNGWRNLEFSKVVETSVEQLALAVNHPGLALTEIFVNDFDGSQQFAVQSG